MKRICGIAMVLALGLSVPMLTAGAASAHGTAGVSGSTLEVVLSEWSLGLREASVDKGELTIHVVNEGRRRHNLTIRGAADGQQYHQTPLLDSNAAREFTLDLPEGQYELYCSVPGHADAGMIAELTVGVPAQQQQEEGGDRGGYY